ncbi:MAG: hypothetical protein E3K37_06865 [Candidatus Kuenenia sp.]|nr:hypothetical protein [Candidatus Kuenenia hertensis]
MDDVSDRYKYFSGAFAQSGKSWRSQRIFFKNIDTSEFCITDLSFEKNKTTYFVGEKE